MFGLAGSAATPGATSAPSATRERSRRMEPPDEQCARAKVKVVYDRPGQPEAQIPSPRRVESDRDTFWTNPGKLLDFCTLITHIYYRRMFRAPRTSALTSKGANMVASVPRFTPAEHPD